MERYLIYEKRFLRVQLLLALALVLLTGIVSLLDTSALAMFYIALGIFFISLLNSVLRRVESIYSQSVFYAIKALHLIGYSLLLYSDNRYIYGVGIVVYLFLSFELFITAGVDKSKKNLIYGLVLIPIVANIVVLVNITPSVDIIMFGVVMAFLETSIYTVISQFSTEYNDEIKSQAHNLEESQTENLNLEQSQAKLKQVYQQMSEQKFQLEVTNTTLNRMASEMFIQSELLQYITATLDIEQLLGLVADSLVGATGCAACSLVVYEEDRKTYYAKSQSTYDLDSDVKFRKMIDAGTFDEYMESTKILVDTRFDPLKYSFLQSKEITSVVINPILHDGRTMGIMIVEHQREDYFAESSIDFFKAIGTQMNIAINNAKIYSRMEDIAKVDSLTDLYNRRTFQEKLEDMYKKNSLDNKSFSVILFDIDYFKGVNDKYGHLFGDEIIKMVAKISKMYAEDVGGFAGRYGGEEFVMVLPKRDINQAYGIIANMHEEMKATATKHEGEDVFIDVSIGITAFPEFGTSAEDLLNRADNAMYYAKEHGRGRIQVDLKDYSVL